MPIRRRIALGTAVVLVLLVAGLALAPVVLRGPLEAKARAAVAAGLDARVDWRRLDLGIFRDFPNLSRKPIHLVEDGVDCNLFRPLPLPAPMPQGFTAGWVGNSGGPRSANGPVDLKGVEILRAGCEAAGVPLILRDLQDGGAWPHE